MEQDIQMIRKLEGFLLYYGIKNNKYDNTIHLFNDNESYH